MTAEQQLENQPNCSDLNETGLISVNQALEQILSTVQPITSHEVVALEQARGRTLHEPVIASFQVPPHTNSAVDGYAIQSLDIPIAGQLNQLEISGTALAGKPCLITAKQGQSVRIMTGAALPEGFDTIIMQEQVQRDGQYILIDHRPKTGQNIRQAGEDIQQGQTILTPGKFLTPADIGLIASLGIAEIKVRRKLRIAIASTGDEVHDLDASLDLGGIYDSNRYLLMATLDRPDIEIINLGILEDNPEALLTCFNETSQHCDIIISSGGVSVGAADHTRMALESTGEIDFWKVAIKPGRPLAFGEIGSCAFFGLPGNPVAVMVTFYQFVLPALIKMLGITEQPICPQFKATATEAIRKRPGRTEIQRGIISQDKNGEWQVKTTGKQGSGILRSMSLANAFIILDHDSASVQPGDQVTVQAFAGLW